MPIRALELRFEAESRSRSRPLRRTVLAFAVACALVLPGTSTAGTLVCQPARCVAETLVFGGVEFPFTVLLPPGYDEAGNTRRYPVLYLLHPAFHDQNAWLEKSDIESFTAGLPDEVQAIVVMPFSPPFGATVDWAQFPVETFDTDALIPYVDATYRTVADRSHRAIAGASYGGFGAFHLAARHPDLFSIVAGFSGGPYAISDLAGIPADAAFWWAVTGVFNANCSIGDPSGLCHGIGDTGGFNAPFGDPVSNEIEFHNHSPIDLAVNLGAVQSYFATGNGVPCDAGDVQELAAGAPIAAAEPIFYYSAVRLEAALRVAHAPYTANFRPCGVHAYVSFRHWTSDLHAFWERAFGPEGSIGSPGPISFDFRSADPAFSVWDWTFTADPSRAKEFLDVRDASGAGITVTGSGLQRVVTSPYFVPGSTITLSNAHEASAIADAAGRITFHVDLGPAHTLQQYTAGQRVAEVPGGYWTSRSVAFGPAA